MSTLVLYKYLYTSQFLHHSTFFFPLTIELKPRRKGNRELQWCVEGWGRLLCSHLAHIEPVWALTITITRSLILTECPIFPSPPNPGIFLISNVVAFKRFIFSYLMVFLFHVGSILYGVFSTNRFFFPLLLTWLLVFSLRFLFCFVSDFLTVKYVQFYFQCIKQILN